MCLYCKKNRYLILPSNFFFFPSLDWTFLFNYSSFFLCVFKLIISLLIKHSNLFVCVLFIFFFLFRYSYHVVLDFWRLILCLIFFSKVNFVLNRSMHFQLVIKTCFIIWRNFFFHLYCPIFNLKKRKKKKTMKTLIYTTYAKRESKQWALQTKASSTKTKNFQNTRKDRNLVWGCIVVGLLSKDPHLKPTREFLCSLISFSFCFPKNI